jgi:ABC-type transport system involved in cytochrome c biogenesis permease subunit
VKTFAKTILAPLASLRLTVVLIVLAMILIYAGTWAQIDSGIWQVQKKYFHSLFTWINFQIFLPRPKAGEAPFPGGFPMLGGYSVGLLLLINLVAAHVMRFKLTWKRVGVILIHIGLILLLVGEGVTSGFAAEGQMTIDEGSYANYAQDIRTAELAIIDPASADHDDVAAIPASRLRAGADVSHSALPVNLHVDQYFPNSAILGPMQAKEKADARATAGDGVGITVVELPPVSGTSEAESVDAPSAYVTLTANGQNLGRYLVSLFLDRPQEFSVGGKQYLMQLRFKRMYKPYTVHLLDFRHDRYLGTNVPKDFSSHIRLVDAAHNVDREVRVWMNNPLRYRGETLYQSGFKPGDKTTILQVVRNPGWLMPYFACAIGALGMVIHFGIMLVGFVRKRLSADASVAGAAKPQAEGWLSGATVTAIGVVSLMLVVALAYVMRPVGNESEFDLKTLATLPVSHEGRIQPLDSLARNSLKMINGRETLELKDGTRMPAIRWLADVFGQPDRAAEYPVFRIDHKDIVGMLNLDPARKRFSLKELLAAKDKLQEQLDRAHEVEAKDRDLFQRKMVELGNKISIYMMLGQMTELHLVPPLSPAEQWQTLSGAMQTRSEHPVAKTWLGLISAYHDDKPADFKSTATAYASVVREKLPQADRKVRFEADFNRFDPFMQCILLYLVAFMLACLSWLIWPATLRRTAALMVLAALVLHTAGLVARVYISGRPPVTNLASSAIFIAWGAVVLAIGVEFFFRDGIAAACAGAIGFLSLLIADRLAVSGDTLKVLQAVLDTNFWLATHVIIINLGHSATFLAGMIGVALVIRGVFTRSLSRDSAKSLTRMIYGSTCFAILFSFVGTVLGGIWADQSWGRFWGWDPKENGACLIVLANALLLHARWGGLVRERGLACLAIFGNMITVWSWFGTNMLGVGLHSYGFMESALFWLFMFMLSQVLLIAVANLPLARWRSYAALQPASATSGASRSKPATSRGPLPATA